MSKPTPDLSILTGSPPRQPRADSGVPEYGDFGIRIARDGTWYHNGLPFRRMALVKLFSTVLQRADNGDYLLATPVERGRIEVEDAPFVAVEMQAEGNGESQRLRFRTNIDEWITADADHPIRFATDPDSDEPRPYLLVRPGLEALILRSVFYELVELADEQADGRLTVWSGGSLHYLGRWEE